MKVLPLNLFLIFWIMATTEVSSQITELPYKPISKIEMSLSLEKIQKFEFSSSVLTETKFDSKKLPFFCRMEHQLEGIARFPVRIRLGDVRYVNKLESKH